MDILVVEDARLEALIVQRHLRQMGDHEIIHMESAEAALAYLRQRSVSLMILDWSLPGMSGVDLVKELRSGEKYRHLPIIMVTGHSEHDDVIAAVKSGVDDYLIKPVQYAILEDKIRRLLGFRIRQAGPEDAEILAKLIMELAHYEQLGDEAEPDVSELRQHLAAQANPRCEALVAEHEASAQVIGFALYFPNYSTFLTRWGMYLEDLYVMPAFRGRGAGFGLLKHVAQIAVERGCQRLDWSVLTWNELALDLYRKLGAQQMSDWAGMRLSGDALRRLGKVS
jgi:diamine N-acetyltransferase